MAHRRPKTKTTPRFKTRLELEWAQVLDVYRIRWIYQPAPTSLLVPFEDVKHQFEFELPDQRIFLDTKGEGSPTRQVLLQAQGVRAWNHLVVLGDEGGVFSFPRKFYTEPQALLLRCPHCGRFFFSHFTAKLCGFCHKPGPWIQETSKLSWFGFPGSPVVVPRDLSSSLPKVPAEDTPPGGWPTPVDVSTVLFNTDEADSAKARESGDWEQLRQQLSGVPRTHCWPDEGLVLELSQRYPNFAEVCDFVLAEIRLARYKPDKSVQLPNLLLVGSPSCGKSSFATQLANLLVGDDHVRIDLGQQTTNFALVGCDSGFRRGKEGRILRAMAGTGTQPPVRNPVIILDEVDKVVTKGQFDPLPALLSVMEKRDAKRFVDEFFTVPVDASGLNFVALANDAREVLGPLASRFTTFWIPDYTETDFLEVVVPNIYREWCRAFFENTFPAELSLETRRRIAQDAGLVPRRVKPLLNQLVGGELVDFWPRPTWETLTRTPGPPEKNNTGDEPWPDEGF